MHVARQVLIVPQHVGNVEVYAALSDGTDLLADEHTSEH